MSTPAAEVVMPGAPKMDLPQDRLYQISRIPQDNVYIKSRGLTPGYLYYTLYYMRDKTVQPAQQGKDADTPIRMLYEESMLPEWMVYHMKVLDSAGSGVSVPTIGKRLGGVYWLDSREGAREG